MKIREMVGLHSLGFALRNQNRVYEAVRYYQQTLTQERDFAPAHHSLVSARDVIRLDPFQADLITAQITQLRCLRRPVNERAKRDRSLAFRDQICP